MKYRVVRTGKPIKIVKVEQATPYDYNAFDIIYNTMSVRFDSKTTIPLVKGFIPLKQGVIIIEPYTVSSFVRIGMGCYGLKCNVEPVIDYLDLQIGEEVPIPKDDDEVGAIFRDAEDAMGKAFPRHDENVTEIDL